MTDVQKRAIAKLSRLKVGALFMEMGTGKTKCALDLMKSKAHKCDYMLWICPCSLKDEIENERKKWQPDLKFDIVGCESLGSSNAIYLEYRNKLEASKCAFVVVDESLKIKNIVAKRTKRILDFGALAKYKLILNGTPISKNVLDIFPQMNFLSQKILGSNFYTFKNKYCEYYLRGRLKGKVRKQCNIPNLISLISPYIFDARLDLNLHKNYSTKWYYLNNKQGYDELKEELAMNYEQNPCDATFFAMVSACQHFYTQCENKKQILENTLEGLDGKTVIFVKFITSISDGALHITGDMDMDERTVALEQFKADKKVLFITYGCGAYGLNLQFAKNAVFADATFNYSEKIQAEARIFRMGQTHDVNYIDLRCESIGLESLFRQNIERKSNSLSTIKNEIQKLKIKEQAKWLKENL